MPHPKHLLTNSPDDRGGDPNFDPVHGARSAWSTCLWNVRGQDCTGRPGFSQRNRGLMLRRGSGFATIALLAACGTPPTPIEPKDDPQPTATSTPDKPHSTPTTMPAIAKRHTTATGDTIAVDVHESLPVLVR